MKLILIKVVVVAAIWFLAQFLLADTTKTPKTSKTPEHGPGVRAEPIRIDVGANKALTVTVPNVRKADVVSMVSIFFGRGDEVAKERFQAAFGQASTITLVIESTK